MPLVPDKAAFQNSLAGLPLVTYQPGETVIVDGSTTGRLLILKKGNVAVVKEDAEIATVVLIAAAVEPTAYAVLLVDQAGSHMSTHDGNVGQYDEVGAEGVGQAGVTLEPHCPD
jgi:hypothetical protein